MNLRVNCSFKDLDALESQKHLTWVCAGSTPTWSAVHLQLTLKRVNQAAALAQLLLDDTQLVLESENTHTDLFLLSCDCNLIMSRHDF